MGLAGLAVALLLPQFLPGVTSSYLLVVAVAAGAALLIAGTEDAAHRGTSLNLFVWALLCPVPGRDGLLRARGTGGRPVPGPDSTTYFTKGGELAASAFHLDMHPVLVFGQLRRLALLSVRRGHPVSAHRSVRAAGDELRHDRA